MTQPTAEQLRMARECAESVLGERYQALIGKDTKDKIPELRARICKVRCGEGDHLTEVQSALLAIQATEARMSAAVELLEDMMEDWHAQGCYAFHPLTSGAECDCGAGKVRNAAQSILTTIRRDRDGQE